MGTGCAIEHKCHGSFILTIAESNVQRCGTTGIGGVASDVGVKIIQAIGGGGDRWGGLRRGLRGRLGGRRAECGCGVPRSE